LNSTTQDFHPRWAPNFIETVLDSISSLVVVLNAEGQILAYNQACEQLSGYCLSEVQGHTVWELLVPPTERAAVQQIFQRLKQGERPVAAENSWLTRTGERRLIVWSNTPLLDAHRQVEYIVSIGVDITAKKQSEALLRQQVAYEKLLGTIARRIYNAVSLPETLKTAVSEVRQLLQADRTLILRFKRNWVGVVLVESLASDAWSQTQGLQIRDPDLQQTFLPQYQQGQTSAIRDIVHTANCPLSLLIHFQAKAALITPILQGEELWGLLIVHQCSHARDWLPFEIQFLSQLATQLAIAIQQSELYDRLQGELAQREQVEQVLQVAKDELEQRVASRTADLRQLNAQLQKELTERQQAEAALRISQKRFASILDIADDAIITIDQQQRVTLFNQGAERIFGYSTAEILGQSLGLLIPQRCSLVDQQHVQYFGDVHEAIRQVGARRDIVCRRKDGSEFPAEASISKLEHAGETIFTVILRDITTRKQAKAELERLSRQNELILNSMGEGLCGLNLKAEIMFANQAASQLLGYSVDALVGRPIDLIILEADSAEPTAASCLSPIYASLQQGSVHQAIHARFCRQDESTFPAEYMSTPLREHDEIVGAVITFKDISQRQQIEQMKDEFISVVSHELRTPLTSIHGSLRMLASGVLSAQPEKRQRLISIAADSTERLVRLINDVLDVERIEAGKLKMVKVVCDVADLIQQAINTMQPLADKADIALSASTSAAQIWVDPDRLLQTLTNLLSNAIKFSEPHSPVWITADLVTADQLPADNTMPISDTPYVRVGVHDYGRGIPNEKLDTIFERFQQADSSDARIYEGTGLGLSICRNIIQQHAGYIWVNSRLGKGSTFYFALPQYMP
ncbi:MAG: PAS domain S-box protein, partial [Leptolyngbya sp. SIO4C1]|nr:PAS domain S-box protein [Leptolyngbya sp. SIO4C1]